MYMSNLFTSCTKCGNPLDDVEGMFPHRRRTDFPHKSNALVLLVTGGYGMFIDEPSTGIILCGGCALQLFAENPWLERWINQQAGNVSWQ